ncbi:alpha/beta fold hydrolase [Sandaracinus amylolyticus]|uniref:Uncharacterized protein n=1 Tax=Sandaracinus amylolyticus TaxID=927083 RepID=A0A0F6SGU9_9BACT|nr:hypothetical protein [Sandaracinus amylolyticus]AKF09324.1 hypothetical protein DB32_006473 [Sandaracinus amylolyticus]
MTDRPSFPDGPPVLQTGTTETRYQRAGRGSPVLLLFTDATADALGARLFERLAAGFRVIAPTLPPGVEIASWLRDLIEGLGLIRPAIVADEPFVVASLALSTQEPDRVGAIVVLARAAHDGEDPGMLCVRVDPTRDAASAEAQIVSFLSRGAR